MKKGLSVKITPVTCLLTFFLIFGLTILLVPIKTHAVQIFKREWETEWGDEYDSLAEAWEAIPNRYMGEDYVRIKLMSDQGISEDLSTENFTCNVHLDLNGYVLYNEAVDEFDIGIKLFQDSKYTFDICDSSGGRGGCRYFEKNYQNKCWTWDPYCEGNETADGWGGGLIYNLGVLVSNDTTCTIRDVLFVGRGAGVTCTNGSYLNLYNDKFYGCTPGYNSANTFGGAVTVYTDDGNDDNRVHAAIQDCTFKYNYSPFAGGAIYAGCSIALKDTTIVHNTSYERGGGIFAGRSFGIVFDPDGCSFIYGGTPYRASSEASGKKDTDEGEVSKDYASLTGVDAPIDASGNLFVDKNSTGESDQVNIIVCGGVIVTDNYDELYTDCGGDLEPSNIYLKEEIYRDPALGSRYRSYISVDRHSQPNFRIGVRKSGFDNMITTKLPYHDCYLNYDTPCFFADDSVEKERVGYKDAFIEYVPSWGNSYKLLYDPVFIDSEGVHYDSIEEAIGFGVKKLEVIKSTPIECESMAGENLSFYLNKSNLVLANKSVIEGKNGSISITNIDPKKETTSKNETVSENVIGPQDVITYVIDNNKDGIYDIISESGKPANATDPYVQVYGRVLVGASDKCGVVSGTQSATDIRYDKGIYSFTSYFNDYCANNKFTDIKNVTQDVYICDGKQQFTITIPTSILSHKGNKVYHFGKVSNSSSNSFTIGELAEDGSITITSSSPWTGRQSFTVELVSDVINFVSYTITVNVNSGTHDFLADGENDTTKTECEYCGNKNIAYTGITVDIKKPTYDGINAKTPEVVVSDGDTKLKEGTDYTVDATAQTEVGTTDYMVTIIGIGDYTATRKENWNLNKANPEAKDFDYTAPSNLTYDKTGKTATVAVKSGVQGMSDISNISYKSTKGGSEMTVTAPTNAGTYKVYVEVAEGQNYNATTTPIEVGEFTIAKADLVKGKDYKIPTGLKANCGDNLSSVKLPYGFVWTSQDVTLLPDSETGSSKITKLAKYLPTDTENYEVAEDIEIPITIYHKDEDNNHKCDICGTKCVIVSGYMYTENGNIVPGNMAALKAYVADEEASIAAPVVMGYNFVGWYKYDSSVENTKHYTGENLCTSRTYYFTVTEDTDLVAVYKPLGSVEITIDGGTDFNINGESKSTEDVSNYSLGSQVTVVCNSADFEYWKNSAGMVLSRNKTYTFTVTGKESVSAVLNTIVDNQATVVFESYYGQVMSRNQYASGATLEAEPGLPYRYGYDALGWDYNGDGSYKAASDTFAVALNRAFESEGKIVKISPVYELIDLTYKITVENGTGSGTYHLNDKVTVTANEPESGKKFSHWKDETNRILSYNESYQFFVSKKMTVTAVYVDEEVKVDAKGTTAIIETSKDTTGGKLIFVSMSTVPEGCTINKAGIIATNDSSVGTSGEGFNDSTATYVRGNGWTGNAYRFTWTKGNVASGETWYVRAYLIYMDAEGNTHIVYGDVVSQTMD